MFRNVITRLLLVCLCLQAITPPAMATPSRTSPVVVAITSAPARAQAAAGHVMSALGLVEQSMVAFLRATFTPQENWSVVLTPVSTEFKDYAGLDYHHSSRKLLLSANNPNGQPHNFETIAADGTRSPFSNVAGLTGDILIATARDEGQGLSRGGFVAGEVFVTTGVPGSIARLNASGATVQNPWVTLPNENGITGLYLDRTGVFGGDLIVVTDIGGVWRVNVAAEATKLTSLSTRLSGVTSVPDDPDRYGPWAGKILAGAKDLSAVYAVDATGQAMPLQLDVHPQDIDIVPAQENFFAADSSARKIWGASDGAFAGVIGDILITQQSPGIIKRLRWNGIEFVASQIASAAEFKQVAFAPSGINPVPPVKQLYDKIAVVRHSITLLNSGRVEGSLWQLAAEDVTLDGTDTITTDLLVPGTPSVLHSQPAQYGGTLVGSENPEPSDYTITIKGSAQLRHVVARTNPIELENVAAPPAPTGTRDVSISHAGEQIGDPATLRNLSITGNAGNVVVPPGTYGSFSVAGRNVLVFGVADSQTPTVYNLEELTLTASSELRLAGPIVLNVKNRVTLSGSTLGAADNPKRLLLKIATGLSDPDDALKVTGNAVLYGIVRAPQGTITIEGTGRVRGTVACNYLFINGNGVLQITESDIPPPPVNRPPIVDAGGDQSITLPTNSVSLNGTASDDGLPQGSVLQLTWSVVSGPGPVTFSDPTKAISTATFTTAGEYVLKLTASDGQLSSSDTLKVTVVPNNQPPTVDAGPDQTIELPDPAILKGVITDDGMPQGSTVTSTWSVVSGPGPVVFANPNAAMTTASFTDPGLYTLRLTASDTEFTVSDEMQVTVLKNQPPIVNAGPDQEIILPGNAALNGTATDDGLPRGSTLEIFWSFVSGPGPVIFPDATLLNAVAIFTVPGTYVLRLTASDSKLSASDELTIVVKPKPFTERTYSLDADFDEGNNFNVVHDVSNQLQLDSRARNLDFIWVAVSSKGTIVKINTETGQVLGEYFTSPSGQPKDPSRTTVDLNGNVWATNRAGNSVVHIGLVENGQCIDRNGNGTIDTSTGFGDIRAWPNTGGADTNGGVTTATDECVLHYTKVNSFGTRHVAVTKDNDIWVSGTSGRRFDLVDGITGQIKRAEPTVGFGGYGGLIDKQGVIWSSNPMLRWDTSKPLTGANGGNWTGFNHPSYGLCIDSGGNVWNTSFGNGQIRKFAPNGTLLGIFNQGDAFAQGCVVDRNDHVWVAHSLNRSTVGHLKNDGTYVGTVPVQSGPTGVAVDGAGKIWATNHNSRTVSRINPNAGPLSSDGVTRVGAVDFTTPNLGGDLYNYSDMTGSTLSGVPSTGTWSTIFDSGIVGAEWGRIGWTARVCGDASLTVTVASSTNGTTFGPNQIVTNGADPTVANGRFLRIIVNFKRSATGETPVLYDLSVGTSGFTLPVVQNEPPTASAGADQTVTLPDVAKLRGTTCDDGFPRGSSLAISWSKVSGPGDVAFTKPNAPVTDASFTVAGTYVLGFTSSDSEASASDEITVTALPANAAPIVNAGPNLTVTLPNTVTLNGTVSDDGFPVGGTLTTFWSQLSGPGLVTFNEPNSPVTKAIFASPGTYVLRLSANDSHRIGTDDVQVTVNASPALTGATLQLVAAVPGPYVTGTPQTLRATLRNSAGTPLANFGVEFTVAGPNATTGSDVTNSSGVATFTYAGTNPGTDSVTALVRSTATANITSGAVAMTWTLTAQSPPVVQGSIGGPLNNASVTGSVPITVGAGVTLTNAKVEYWPAANPAAVTTLASGVGGGPGTVLATLDTTLIANGNYVIRVTGTDGNGQETISQVIITVTGENKPGRITFSITDMTVPLSGIPITIERTYDSLNRNLIGDFGYGWALEMSGPRLEVSPDNDVTITEPGTGRRVTFQFSPTSFGFPFSFFYQPTYQPEPGVFGKLTSNGCGLLVKSGTGVVCFLSLDINYNPTVYQYTDPYGREYLMTSTGQMLSIKNLDGNVLTFSPNGITSSAGNLTVPFVRDAQGRIEQITDPNGKIYRYTYDANGDLTAVAQPEIDTPMRYEYDPGHFFRKGVDARGNPEATNTYFPNGRLQSITDAMGKTTSYSYDLVNNSTTITHPDNTGTTIQRFDANGLMLSETDPLNRTRTYTYDANRNKKTETDALNKTTFYDYDANGNLKSVTDPLNKTISYINNEHGMPTSTTDQLGKVRTITYDADFNLSAMSDELGTQVSFTWDDHGNPLSMTDGNGKTFNFAFDAFGNVVSKTDPLGHVTSYTYDDMGRVLTMTDSRGVSRFAYDALGRVNSVKDALNNETRFRYDNNGNKIEEINARQEITTFEYDAGDRLTKVNHPDGTSISYTYNFRGQKLTETVAGPAPSGGFLSPEAAFQAVFSRTTTYTYDNAGQMTKVKFADDSEITFVYDEVGRVKSATDERGKTYTYEYDPNCGCTDRLTKNIDPSGNESTFAYDASGRMLSFIDANNRETKYEYDVRDLLVKTIHPDNTTETNVYDGMGRGISSTDQEGRITKFTYDEKGNMTSVVDALNQTTQFIWDAQDNLVSSTDPLGRTTRYEYDALNRVIKRILPLGMSELYTYDQIGNLATRRDFRGKQTNYDYDSMDRLIAKTPDASLGEATVTYTYNETGQRHTMTDGSGTTNYTYDVRDRLLTKETPQGTLTYGYDRTGNLLSMRSSNTDGVTVDYTYDIMNRLESVVDNRLPTGTNTYAYDKVGNLKSDLRPNGVKTDYTYNVVNRLTDMLVGKGATQHAAYTFTLDRTGRRTSATELGGRTVSYTYDPIYRLKREAVSGDPNPAKNGAVDYTHDSVGNRLSRISSLAGVLSATSSYDANDRLTSDSYDANGNTRSADGVTYVYDYEDRVKSSQGGAVRIVYDGDGNLASKTTGGVTTKYLIDEMNPTGLPQVAEELVGGQVMRQYTYGNQIISQRQLIGGAWSTSFYSFDGHGSVRQLTNEAGQVTDTYTYDAFGKLLSQTGVTPNVYLYAGERFDGDLGLYYLRARHYNADRGRFTTIDPFAGYIDEPISLHKYLYAQADPVNFIDPLGLSVLAEYGQLVKRIALRVWAAVRALGRAIACVFLYAASWLASIVGYPAWLVVRRLAQRMGLAFCVCRIRKTTPGYKPPSAPDNKRTGDDFRDFLRDLFEALGYDVAPGEPYFNTPRGPRKIDVGISKGGWSGGIEGKVNGSPYKPSQRWKDGWLRRNRNYPVRLIRFIQWRCFRR
ncbi:MAG TPA: RHS repeat-associated core domain-containing protein [Pyrinomonadaceae bacterium]